MKTTRIRIRHALFGALAALTVLWSGPAAAQHQRSVRVVDGEVYVDDRRIPPEQLPDGFEPDGITAHYTFSGDVQPVVRLGDAFFVLDGDRLRLADRTGFFRPPLLRDVVPPEVRVEFREDAENLDPPVPPHAATFDRQARELGQQAARLDELQRALRERFSEDHVREFEQLAREMSQHAARAARIAGDLPRIELEHYLDEIRQDNEGLFDRLVSERQLEQETVERARQIRRSRAGEEREERIEDLRRRLDRIFELKQENRRREIEQLERRLGELERRLAERERQREEIVERRLRELLPEMDW